MDIVIDRKRLFKIQAYSVILIFLINTIALKLYLYSSIWYFDMIMHFFGGFWVGLIALWFFSYKNLSFEFCFKFILKIILSVLMVGVLWEVFEILFVNVVAQNSFNILDTTSDIFFDLAGGIFAVFYFFKKIMLTDKSELQLE